ncbi:putative ribonuclease H-like domain-containing protein [Tanacetum coccineum]
MVHQCSLKDYYMMHKGRSNDAPKAYEQDTILSYRLNEEIDAEDCCLGGGIENLIDLRVKVIRCDNRTEFKNRVMNQFCEMNGMKREFSVARTPQQNGVAERKNRTLIEAARTMLADLKLPTTFWAKAVNTACYVQNRNSKDSPDTGFRPSGEEEKKDAKDPGNESGNPTEGKDSEVPSTEEPRVYQEKDDNDSSTNNVNTASNTINTVSPTVNADGIEVNVVDPKLSIELPDDPNMPELEDIVYSDDDEDVGAEADMNNLDAFMPVSPIPTTRIHKDHPVEQIIRDLHSAPQTRRMTKNLEEHEEPKKVIHALKDPSWIEAKQDELLVNAAGTKLQLLTELQLLMDKD